VPDAERNHYFFGQLLGVAEFELEQTYLREKRWLHNRCLHGWGVVDGLTVSPVGDGRLGIVVEPGLALDPRGREIVVPAPCRVSLAGAGPEWSTVVIAYVEEETERRTIRESYEVSVLPGLGAAHDVIPLAAVRVPESAAPVVDPAQRAVVSSTASLEARIRALEERVAELERSR
jgi:hypothetical protein